MLFTTSTFWLFFAVVFILMLLNSYSIKSLRFMNITLLAASYIFYGAWDWRFTSLLAAISLVSFICGKQISLSDDAKTRRKWLILSVSTSLLTLCYFKYFNFFAQELETLFGTLGIPASWPVQHIILPVGISFFTFQTLTYTIDIYLRKMEWEKDPVKYFTYIAFFPQLVAGPVERARNLLPQFHQIPPITWKNIYQGISLVIFGLFLKVVIADSLAPIVDNVFATAADRNGGELLLGAIYFACQIYGDFCGYSTIAIGVAQMLGFRLMTNFQTPYFSTSIRMFWRNWHISLSSFFRDYVYVPLGGSRSTALSTNRNLLVTFTLSGLWHGANWTFVAWGSLHGLAMIASVYLGRSTDWLHNLIKSSLGWATTMSVVLIGWVIFRSPDITSAIHYIGRIVTDFQMPQLSQSALIYVSLVPLVDFLWFKDVRLGNGLGLHFMIPSMRIVVEALVLSVMLVTILLHLIINGGNNEFIYFQF